jgi:hypothetical protein
MDSGLLAIDAQKLFLRHSRTKPRLSWGVDTPEWSRLCIEDRNDAPPCRFHKRNELGKHRATTESADGFGGEKRWLKTVDFIDAGEYVLPAPDF